MAHLGLYSPRHTFFSSFTGVIAFTLFIIYHPYLPSTINLTVTLDTKGCSPVFEHPIQVYTILFSKMQYNEQWIPHLPQDAPFEIRCSAGKGRGGFAIKDIEAASCVLHEEPLFVIISQELLSDP